MVLNFQPRMSYHGHDFAFLLRVDVEHVEAQKYTGDPRTCRVATCTLLDLLEELDIRQTFAVVGHTAEVYPDVVREIVQHHCLAGHSMFHQLPYRGMTLHAQQLDMRHQRFAIEAATGTTIRGIFCPYKGLADEDTLRAAIDEGIEYVHSGLTVTDSKTPRLVGIEGRDRPVMVPGGQMIQIGDWSDRRREWPWAEEYFSDEVAERRWRAAIDTAGEESRICMLVVHSWMLHTNEHELRALRRTLRYARESGAWMGDYDSLADLVFGRAS